MIDYSVEVVGSIKNAPGTWNCLEVGIFERNGEVKRQIGKYIRNYHILYDTFFPFKQGDAWYALYSKDYTCTRIMELPSCEDIGGESPVPNGFCPIEYYVPTYYEIDYEGTILFLNDPTPEYLRDDDKTPDDVKFHEFGFVSGCVWGDDWSWKVQFIDLSQVSDGKIKRTEKFGYIWLPNDVSLRDAIDLGSYDEPGESIGIATSRRFSL